VIGVVVTADGERQRLKHHPFGRAPLLWIPLEMRDWRQGGEIAA
jgi:hypothetical protein